VLCALPVAMALAKSGLSLVQSTPL
jgi:hypothetical protein